MIEESYSVQYLQKQIQKKWRPSTEGRHFFNMTSIIQKKEALKNRTSLHPFYSADIATKPIWALLRCKDRMFVAIVQKINNTNNGDPQPRAAIHII